MIKKLLLNRPFYLSQWLRDQIFCNKRRISHVPPFTYLSVRFILAAVLTALIFWKTEAITREDLIAVHNWIFIFQF